MNIAIIEFELNEGQSDNTGNVAFGELIVEWANSKVLQALEEALRERVESHDGTLQSRNSSSSLSSEIDDLVAEVFAAFVRLQGPTPAMIVPPIGSKGNRSHPISLITTRVVTINDSP